MLIKQTKSKQRIPYIIRISYLKPTFGEKKSAHYTWVLLFCLFTDIWRFVSVTSSYVCYLYYFSNFYEEHQRNIRWHRSLFS